MQHSNGYIAMLIKANKSRNIFDKYHFYKEKGNKITPKILKKDQRYKVITNTLKI